MFKPVDESIKKSTAILVRLSKADAETIRESANIRNLSVSEFMRRAALGRKADVRYETQIVLQLIDVGRAIRQIHKAMVDQGMTPPEEIWLPIMKGASDAIVKISI